MKIISFLGGFEGIATRHIEGGAKERTKDGTGLSSFVTGSSLRCVSCRSQSRKGRIGCIDLNKPS
jgi:hypothetical protein